MKGFYSGLPFLLGDSLSPETMATSVQPDCEWIKGWEGLLTDQDKTGQRP